jgi:hypothetical protein
MKWFNTKDTLETNDSQENERDVSDQDSGGGAEGVDATDCAELGARGCEVEPEVIVDESGGVMESFSKVWQPLSTYVTC